MKSKSVHITASVRALLVSLCSQVVLKASPTAMVTQLSRIHNRAAASNALMEITSLQKYVSPGKHQNTDENEETRAENGPSMLIMLE